MWLLAVFISVLTLSYLYVKWNYSYWQRKGFAYVQPKIPFGVLDSVRRREQTMGTAIEEAYNSTKENVVGIYLLLRPALLVRDAQLVRDIMVKDFGSFHDRGVYVDEENDPMSGNLFGLKGQKWKTLRAKLTPSFTSGKLKGMFGTVEDISEKMLNHMNKIVPNEGSVEIEMKNVLSAFAIDIIGSAIFGLDVNSFKDPNNEFYEISKQINRPSIKDVVRGTAQFIYPALEKIFVKLNWTEEGPTLMKDLVEHTINYREKHNVVRKDLLQLLLQLRNTGKINADDNIWTVESIAEEFKSMSIDTVAAQMFLFYAAGFETTASAAAFTIYELAQYPDILAKAKKDVEDALEKHEKLCYDAIQDMKYLELCVMETVRKYPGLPILNRECTEDYPIPGTDKVITKGTPIIISLLGMHRDPEYFPNPMGYEPERFLPENMNYNPTAYMPFGEGPRHCIAQRMGRVNVKVALAQILTHFEIHPKERREIEIDNFGVTIMPKGGIHVHLSRKKTN